MSRWRWFRSGWDTAISLPPRIFIRIWTTLPRFLQQKQCWTGLEWVQIRKMTLKKVWFLSRTERFLSCYEIVKLKNSAFCIKKLYRALKKAHCTVDWRSIRDLNSGGATNALSHFECDPFDLLGNAPYSNPPKSSPEKGEKSRREQQIFNCRKQWFFWRWVVRKSMAASKMPAWFRVLPLTTSWGMLHVLGSCRILN